jgi:CelD/BcsL family acetyltransferase involved in cellulose biosynthesis
MGSVEVVEADEAVPPALAAEWDRLARAIPVAPFLWPGWIEAWARAFGAGPLELLALRRDGDLTALLPLERRGKTLRAPANTHTPGYGVVARSRGDAEALMAAALERARGSLALGPLGEGPGGLPALTAAANHAGASVHWRVTSRSPYIDTSGDLASYERALDAKMLREARRRRRRLESEDEVKLEVVDGSADLEELLDQGFALEGAAWKDAGGTAIRSDLATSSFYRAVARWAAGAGTLRLAFLRVGERALAFDFCLEHGGAHYLLKTGYDPEARRLGPGIMMRWEMIARAFRERLASYEFLGKDEPWKLRWTNATRVHVSARVFKPTAAGAASRLWWMGARPLAARLVRRK